VGRRATCYVLGDRSGCPRSADGKHCGCVSEIRSRGTLRSTASSSLIAVCFSVIIYITYCLIDSYLFIYLFISVFNYAVSSTLVSNGLYRTRKEAIVTGFVVLSGYLPGGT
jgi:hypothetical protein